MPYPNEHSARLKSPKGYIRFRRQNDKFGSGIHAIWGITSAGKAELQAIRFSVSKFTAVQARAWCSAHDHKPILFEPASKAAGFGFVHQGQSALATSALDKDENVSFQRFKKDMIRIGVYTHPEEGWAIDVTEERLHRWAVSFKKMKENGVDVEVPLDHSASAVGNLGYVVDMFVEPDDEDVLTLFGILEIRGEDAIDIVKRNKNVSVLINQDFKDGKENAYGEVITHCSVVQQPIVPGQSDFVPIAASLTTGNEQVSDFYYLSKDKEKNKMDKEMLEKLRKLLGAGEDFTEENALSRIEERFKALTEKTTTLEKSNLDLEAKLKIAASKKGEKDKPPEINENLAEQMRDTGEQQLSLLVQAGKITPAVKEKLELALVGKTGEPNIMALSMQKGKPSLMKQVIDALKENDLVELGEKTGAQVTLSRVAPGKPDAKKANEEQQAVTDEMVEMVDGSSVKKD